MVWFMSGLQGLDLNEFFQLAQEREGLSQFPPSDRVEKKISPWASYSIIVHSEVSCPFPQSSWYWPMSETEYWIRLFPCPIQAGYSYAPSLLWKSTLDN